MKPEFLKRCSKRKQKMKRYIDEEREWINLTPAERIIESGKLWKLYLDLGGELDPEPNPQSPFYFPEIRSKESSNRRTGLYHIRRHRI